MYQKRLFLTHLIMDGYYLVVLLLQQQMSLLHFSSSSKETAQKAVVSVKGIGGVLHNLFDFTFRIVLCGMLLFLNGFLKSPEKLIVEKYNIKTIYCHYKKEKGIPPCYR